MNIRSNKLTINRLHIVLLISLVLLSLSTWELMKKNEWIKVSISEIKRDSDLLEKNKLNLTFLEKIISNLEGQIAKRYLVNMDLKGTDITLDSLELVNRRITDSIETASFNYLEKRRNILIEQYLNERKKIKAEEKLLVDEEIKRKQKRIRINFLYWFVAHIIFSLVFFIVLSRLSPETRKENVGVLLFTILIILFALTFDFFGPLWFLILMSIMAFVVTLFSNPKSGKVESPKPQN